MKAKPRKRIHPLWWTAFMFAVIGGMVLVCSALFEGTFRPFIPVTVISDRAGLIMESGAKVRMRGVEVGRVGAVTLDGHEDLTTLALQMYPNQLKHIPANVSAQIRASTIFGAKYVDLIYPDQPSAQRLAAGAVVRSTNVTTEVNTVFQNVVGVLNQIDPARLNAVLTALADGLRGQGERIGEATTDGNKVLQELNARSDTLHQDVRSLSGFSDTYSSAAQNILHILSGVSTTSITINNRVSDLDVLLLNTIGLAHSGIRLLAPNRDNLVHAINTLGPTTALLLKYNPEYTCIFQGAKWILDKGAGVLPGMNGRSAILDATIMFGDDLYRYPDNLQVVAAKGGPGGKPGCGSLPDASKNYPVRQLVRDTGWGTGLDWRPNPGIGHPWWVDFFPVTRGMPQPPSLRGKNPPAIGPVPYPGAPPYGAPLYGPDGLPLYPAPPGVPAPTPASPAPANQPSQTPSQLSTGPQQ